MFRSFILWGKQGKGVETRKNKTRRCMKSNQESVIWLIYFVSNGVAKWWWQLWGAVQKAPYYYLSESLRRIFSSWILSVLVKSCPVGCWQHDTSRAAVSRNSVSGRCPLWLQQRSWKQNVSHKGGSQQELSPVTPRVRWQAMKWAQELSYAHYFFSFLFATYFKELLLIFL